MLRPEGQCDVYSPVVPLADMTRKALDTLATNKNGFFLFVEEEGVDEFSHNDNATRMLRAMSELDKTVAMLRLYASKHPDTLLVVTGDHDCGRLTVEDAGTADESGDGVSAEDGPFPIRGTNKSFDVDWTTDGHTGVPVPATAQGPQAERFNGTTPTPWCTT